MPTDGGQLRRRLRPLYLVSFLQGLALWVPIGKLFMVSIGFDAATISVMAPGPPSPRPRRCG